MAWAAWKELAVDYPITILHLSDLQFGRHHGFGVAEPFEALLGRLEEDLRSLKEEMGLHPDLLVLTGDMTRGGRKSEFEDALRFVEDLTGFLALNPQRVVIVPGNHDVNRDVSKAYFSECAADEVDPVSPYWAKWRNYLRFFHVLYRDNPGVEFTEDEPWSFFEIPDLEMVVAGLNSTMAESHRDEDHYGLVGEEQLYWFRERLTSYREKGWRRVGAVHHNVIQGASDDSENLRDAEDLKRILGPYLNLILHGHTHDGKLHWHDPQTPILSSGSAALKPQAGPGEIPNQYQVIQIWADRFRRWTRGYAPDLQRWIGDTRASADGSQWWDEQPLLSPRVDRKRPDPDDLRFEARDDFLSRVETVCRLREKDAEIRRLRTGSPPVEYLRVSVEKDGIVRCYPVGAIRGDVNPESFDAFLAVSRRYQRTDQGLISILVYGGEPSAEETVRRARAERVRLRSFLEYQGLLDFRGYVDRQTRKLAADPLYPPSLYVPQRMRFSLGQEERNTGDALASVNEWLVDSYGRFVLVLGDFGTGKTFLLHELARRMGEKPGSLTPILIEMRALEKSHRLDSLVAQHLAHSGMEQINLKAFHYMLEEGRIALLFDGFDELALRVTYDRAAEHLSSLIEAARGDAKVVITSRTQHFESDRQVKTALLERVELLSGHRIARLERFDEKQIRRFLVNRLGSEPEAEARLALLDEVKDLMGLSRNPRMLGFVSELSEEELRVAKEKGGEISAAGLYQLLLDRWLGYEYERHQPRGALPALTVEERWEAVTQLALRLWQRTERAVNISELTEEVARAVVPLAERSLTEGVAAHQVGSGSLLVRDAEGAFSFIHQSVLEWLVARRAARELEESRSSEVLAVRAMSALMADFLRDLAGQERSGSWAREMLRGGVSEVGRQNALLLLERMGEAAQKPLRLAGEDLQGQDFSGRDLSGSDLSGADLSSARMIGTRLRRARLVGTKLVGVDLSRADLRDTDLRNTDLSTARLLGADLRQADLTGSYLRRAKLVGAVVDAGTIDKSQLHGAAPPRPETIEAWVASQPSNCKTVAWSPDRTLLITGHQDGTLRLWESATGREIRRLLGHQGAISSVVCSPDGLSLASSSADETVRIWDLVTGREQRRLEGRPGRPTSLAYSPDGLILASGSTDETVCIWDPATGREKNRLEGHQNAVTSVACSPDAQTLASGSADQTVRIWDLPTGREMLRLEGHQSEVTCLAYSPDGSALASGSEDQTVRIWDLTTGRERLRLEGRQSEVTCLAYSPDGSALASGSKDQTVRIWDPATGREKRSLEGHQGGVLSVAYRPDGSALASSSTAKTIRIWDVVTGREQRRLGGRADEVRCVAYSPDGLALASGSAGKTVRIWDLATAREQHRLTGHQGGVRCLAYSPDAQSLATGSDDKTVRIWDVATGREERRLSGHQGGLRSVAFSPDCLALASGSEDRTVRIWDVAAGREQCRLAGHQGGVRCLAFSPDGQALASGSADKSVRTWDVATGREIGRLTGHQGGVRCLAFSPDGQTLAAGSADKSVRIWDVATSREIHRLKDHLSDVTSLAFSPDGQVLVSGSADKKVRTWDPANGRTLQQFVGHLDGVRSVAFSPDGQTLTSASADNTLRLWDIASGRCLVILAPFPEGWAAFTPDGRYKLGGETFGAFWHTIGLCRFEPGELDPYLSTPLRIPDEEHLVGVGSQAIGESRSRPGWSWKEPRPLHALPITIGEWKRPERAGDFLFHFSLPGESVLLAAVDVAGHGSRVHPSTLFLQGWFSGWMRGLSNPPRLQSLAESFSNELRSAEIDVSCYFALLSRRRNLRHTVSYEGISYGFPAPLLITGPPMRTLESTIPGTPLPAEELVAQPVRIDHLSAPWRLVVATDGLLRRLGGGNEQRGLRFLREWQSGPFRDESPEIHLKLTERIVDDELLGLIQWNQWDLVTVLAVGDDAERHRVLEIIRQRVHPELGSRYALRLKQAMVEALDNARRHGYGGGSGMVTVRFRDEEHSYRVEIEDEGGNAVSEDSIHTTQSGFAVMRYGSNGVDVRNGSRRGTIVSLIVEKIPRANTDSGQEESRHGFP